MSCALQHPGNPPRFTGEKLSTMTFRNVGIWHLKTDATRSDATFACVIDGEEVATRTIYTTRKQKSPPIDRIGQWAQPPSCTRVLRFALDQPTVAGAGESAEDAEAGGPPKRAKSNA
jgi:hypothetical protein